MDSTSLSEEDTYHQVCGHYRFVMLEMAGPYVAYWMLTEGGRSKRIDVRALTEDQLAWLSAVVGSQISLQRNPRLNYALKKESSSPTSRFLQELPGTTLYEVGNLIRRGDDFSNLYALSNLKKEVAKHLANVGSGTPEMSRDYRLADSNLSEVSTDESVLEELFLAKQELAAARASGKITESEDQVLELRSRDYSEDEIASKLRKGKGTVKTLTYRGRKKLRPAAGQ